MSIRCQTAWKVDVLFADEPEACTYRVAGKLQWIPTLTDAQASVREYLAANTAFVFVARRYDRHAITATEALEVCIVKSLEEGLEATTNAGAEAGLVMLVDHMLKESVWIILESDFLVVRLVGSLNGTENGVATHAKRDALWRRQLPQGCAEAACLHGATSAFSRLMLYHFARLLTT